MTGPLLPHVLVVSSRPCVYLLRPGLHPPEPLGVKEAFFCVRAVGFVSRFLHYKDFWRLDVKADTGGARRCVEALCVFLGAGAASPSASLVPGLLFFLCVCF